MKSEIKKLPRGQVELTIELTTEEYQPFLQQAAKLISEETKFPGFRPGKASYEVIKQKVGEQEIWQQALEPAVQKTFVKALAENNLLTVGSPKIEVIKLAPGNSVIYKASISLLPGVELADYSKIKVKSKPVEISDKDIQKTLTDLQKMRAKESLVDRAAQKGDKVEIDFETFLDKIPVDGGQHKKFPLVIGEGTFIPGFEDQMVGLKKDEEKTFQLRFPENYHQKSLAGKPADFKVKMLSVYQLDLPALNDEFAQNLGEFKNFKELQDQIKKNITAEKESQEKQRLEDEIIDKLIDQSKFEDIPDLLIGSETKKMLDELEHSLSHQGIKLEDYLNHLKKKVEELSLDFVPGAIKRIKGALIVRELVKKENIHVGENEIEQEIQKIRQSYNDDPEVAKQTNWPEYKNYLRNILTSRKAIDLLKSAMAEK